MMARRLLFFRTQCNIRRTTTGEERKKEMLLSWLLETSEENTNFSTLKELAQKRTKYYRRK